MIAELTSSELWDPIPVTDARSRYSLSTGALQILDGALLAQKTGKETLGPEESCNVSRETGTE